MDRSLRYWNNAQMIYRQSVAQAMVGSELRSDRVINLLEEGHNMEVQATQIKVDEAGDDIGAQAATGNAEARKKKSDVVTTPKKRHWR